MSAIIRLKSVPAGGFRHGGLIVGASWAPFKVAELTESQRSTLKECHGRFVMVHEADRAHLVELGLAFKSAKEPLVDAKPEPKKPEPKKPEPKIEAIKSGPVAAGKD